MKRRRFTKDMVAFILIISGILVILFPSLRNYYYDREQQKVMEDYLESMAVIENIEDDQEGIPVESMNSPQEKIKSEKKDETGIPKKIEKKWPVEATLKIDKINLFMPVIADATKEHLNVSIASIDNTGKPWENNNYAIAGHRSRTFGRHFNRLNELEIDDEIVVIDPENNHYIYNVSSKEIVDKEEISVLEDTGISQITLITCDPITVKNPPTRLVIKAVKVN